MFKTRKRLHNFQLFKGKLIYRELITKHDGFHIFDGLGFESWHGHLVYLEMDYTIIHS